MLQVVETIYTVSLMKINDIGYELIISKLSINTVRTFLEVDKNLSSFLWDTKPAMVFRLSGRKSARKRSKMRVHHGKYYRSIENEYQRNESLKEDDKVRACQYVLCRNKNNLQKLRELHKIRMLELVLEDLSEAARKIVKLILTNETTIMASELKTLQPTFVPFQLLFKLTKKGHQCVSLFDVSQRSTKEEQWRDRQTLTARIIDAANLLLTSSMVIAGTKAGYQNLCVNYKASIQNNKSSEIFVKFIIKFIVQQNIWIMALSFEIQQDMLEIYILYGPDLKWLRNGGS